MYGIMAGSPQAFSHQGRQCTVDEEFQDELLLADWKLPLADSLGSIAQGLADILGF